MKAFLMALGATLTSAAFGGGGLCRAPVNPAFEGWTTNVATDTAFGFRPSPVDMSHRSVVTRSDSKADALPSSWDSREHGWVTPVKNQGSYGTCWAHSTLACLETAFLKTEGVTYDLSENHLARHASSGYALGFNDGGNNTLAAAMLTDWQDPLLESQDPYPNRSSTVVGPPMAHVQEIVFVPVRTGSTDNADLKRAIRDYGAVSVSYYHDGTYLNRKTAAYCYKGVMSANHAVTAVGWDDDYPASAFASVSSVTENGAFLIKNSWGKTSSSTTNGYMWISYSDVSFCRDAEPAAYPCPSATNNYGRLYSYDENGWVTTYGYRTNVAFAANVFTATSDEPVAAVGFYAVTPGTQFVISIYTHPADGDPTSGTLAATVSGSRTMTGYYTVPLAEAVPVKLGERFSVVIRLDTPGYGFPVAADETATYSDGSIYCVSVAMPGESFLSDDGAVWEDVSSLGINCCLKAYSAVVATVTDPSVFYVAASGDDANDGTSASKPLRTIQAAIDRATSGDTIRVAAGRYAPIVTHGKAVDILSDGGASVTFIDGGGTNRCADLRSTVAGQIAYLEGFALENGRVVTNDEDWDPVALGAGARDGMLSRCAIRNCRAEGLYVEGGTVDGGILWDCLVVSNASVSTSGYLLGGVCCCSELYNCTVADNAAESAGAVYGGAFYCGSSGWACNSIIVGTVATGTAVYGENCFDAGDPLSKTLQGGDPRFVDRAHGDYRLAEDSPCVDAGYSDVILGEIDLVGVARVQGRAVDQGCYESSYTAADVVVPAVTATRGSRHFGVFVGVNKYKRSGIDLSGCVPDATAMRERCLQSGLWSADDVTLLTDADATEQTVRAAVTNVQNQAQSGDTFVFYQSSHGGNALEDATTAYLCEYDYGNGVGGNDGCYFDAELASDLLSFADGVRVLVIVDACHSAGLFKSWDSLAPGNGLTLLGAFSSVSSDVGKSFNFGSRVRSALLRQSLPLCSVAAASFVPGQVTASGSVGTNIAFITAADYCQYSWDGSSGGAFTSALTSGWKSGAADGATEVAVDGKVDFYELFAYGAARATGYSSPVVYRTEAQCDNAELLRGTLAAYLQGTWPETEINPSDSPEEQAAKIEESLLLAGFPPETAAAVTNAADYAAMQTWANETGVSLSEMTVSSTALLSPAVDASELIDEQTASNFLNAATTVFVPDSSGGLTVGISLSLKAFAGDSVNDSLLKAAIGVVGADDLAEDFTADELSVDLQRQGASVEISVRPPAEASSYFLRTRVR